MKRKCLTALLVLMLMVCVLPLAVAAESEDVEDGETPSCDHSYNEETTILATCTTVGEKTHTCDTCGDSYTEKISALGHTWSDPITAKKESCTAAGSTYKKCTRDGCTATGSYVVIPATGHTWGTPTVLKAATCTEAGKEHKKCEKCSTESYYDTTALGHNYDKGKVTTPATCSKKGVKTFTCQNDESHTYTEDIPATGLHDFDIVFRDRKYHWYECSNKGCDAEYVDTHDFTRWRVVRDATRDTHGLMYRVCKDCDFKYWRRFDFFSNPKTGDYIMIAAIVLVAAGGALAGLYIYHKKKKKNT